MGIKQLKPLLAKAAVLIFVFVLLLPGVPALAQTAYSNEKFDKMAYVLMDLDSGKVLAQHDADRRIYPASTTKLMTALLLMENKGLEGETTVGTEINGMPTGSSLMRISVGEKVSVKDLFYGLMLCSGNDAANTIGVYVSGSVDAFVALMNQRAAELGMANTHFNSAYGCFLNQDETAPIPEEKLGVNHYTTASDMAKLTLEAAKHPEILQAGGTETYTLSATNKNETREIENSNPLVHNLKNHPEFDQFRYDYATGLKTGTVNNIVVEGNMIRSYGNVVATAKKDDLSLAALVFDDESESSSMQSYKRWSLAPDLFNYGFANYAWVDMTPYISLVTLTRPVAPASGESIQGNFEIESKNTTDIAKVLMDSADAQSLKDGTVQIEKQIKVDDAIASSMHAGDTVGSVQYTLNGQEVCAADLVVKNLMLAQTHTADIQGGSAGAMPQPTGQAQADTGAPGWLLWVLIPAGGVGALFLVREINLRRRKRRRRRRYQGLGSQTRRKL